MSSQLSSIKATDSDTLFITTAVEQLTLILKQAQALGIKRQIITLGGSQNPDQLISQAGSAANGTMHDVMFMPWFPENAPDPATAKSFIAEWKKRGLDPNGLTEGVRGYDGVRTIAAAVTAAGAADPEKIREALWKIQLTGLTGNIKFQKVGPTGKESGQSLPATYVVKIEGGKLAQITH
jgi:branched-chain amino acid transport system substrate-binding protein